jgi:hypothetical protein
MRDPSAIRKSPPPTLRALQRRHERASTMNERELASGAATAAPVNRMIQRFRRWLRRRCTNDQYLADATDLADLERRMRLLERSSVGPMFQTFNH